MSKLDKEEQEILDAFDSGKLKKAKNISAQLEHHKIVSECIFWRT